MTYQYGDSKASSLKINYIDFLRVAIAQSVAIVRAEDVMLHLKGQRSARESEAERLVARLEELGRSAIAALDPAAGDTDPHARRLRESVTRAVQDSVSREVSEVKRLLAEDVARFQVAIGEEQRKVIQALESLIVNEDLPGAAGEVHVALDPDETYTAGWLARTDYGIEILVELEIPTESPFANSLRVGQIDEQLEIHAPQTAGWLRKETKMVAHRLGKHHVVGVGVSSGRVKLMLRSGPDASSPGYNVSVNRKNRAVEIARAEGEPEPFDVDPSDVPALLALADHLTEEAEKLRGHRSALLKASLDETSLAEHARPSELVEKLMRAAGPVVHEIARHSPPDELVLRRMLGESRREEMFVTKKELLDRIEELPEERRALFAPLGLDQKVPAKEAAREVVLVADEPDGDGPAEGWDLEESTAVLFKAKSLRAPAGEDAPASDDEKEPAPGPRAKEAGDDSAAAAGKTEEAASSSAAPDAVKSAVTRPPEPASGAAGAGSAARRSPGTVPPPARE